jgi:hypothetical protein
MPAIDRVANLGPRQRLRRLVTGGVALVVAVAVGVVLAKTGAPRPWRLVLFVPLWSAALGVFQYLDKT